MKKLMLSLLILLTFIFCSQNAYTKPKDKLLESIEYVWSKNGDCEVIVIVGDFLKTGEEKQWMEKRNIKPWIVFAYYGKVPGRSHYDWVPSSAYGEQVSFKIPQVHLQLSWLNKMPYAERYHNQVKRDFELHLFTDKNDPLKSESYIMLRGSEYTHFGMENDFLDILHEEWKLETWVDGSFRSRSRFVGCTREDIEQLFDSTRPPEPASQEYVDFLKANRPTVTIKDYQHSGDWKSGTFTQTYKLGFNATCQSRPRSFSIKVKYFPGFEPAHDLSTQAEELQEIKLKWEPGTQPKTITITIPQIGLSRYSEYSKGPIFVRELTVIVTESVTGRDPIVTFHELKVGATVTVD